MAKKGKKLKISFNINEKLRNVRILLESGRKREAIAYLYIIYTQLANLKLGVQKKVSQTIRDYAIIMVKEYNQNPQNIYPFIQKVEKAIYGGVSVTDEMFQDIVNSFNTLHIELTGKNMPSF
ncbi:MAG: hypothetical protein ACTSRZ_12005 [Promethearchaeota archaeon]